MPDCNLLMMRTDGNVTGRADLWRDVSRFSLYVRHVCGRQHLALPLHFMTFPSISQVSNPAHCLKVSLSTAVLWSCDRKGLLPCGPTLPFYRLLGTIHETVGLC